jgi:hypothetical protein
MPVCTVAASRTLAAVAGRRTKQYTIEESLRTRSHKSWRSAYGSRHHGPVLGSPGRNDVLQSCAVGLSQVLRLLPAVASAPGAGSACPCFTAPASHRTGTASAAGEPQPPGSSQRPSGQHQQWLTVVESVRTRHPLSDWARRRADNELLPGPYAPTARAAMSDLEQQVNRLELVSLVRLTFQTRSSHGLPRSMAAKELNSTRHNQLGSSAIEWATRKTRHPCNNTGTGPLDYAIPSSHIMAVSGNRVTRQE